MSAAMTPQISIPKPQAFTLLEVLIALFIFSIAVISLVEAINGTARATLIARRERQVTARLESILLEATRLPQTQKGAGFNVVHESTLKEGDVTYLIRMKPLELKNETGQPMRDMFDVTAAARWTEGSQTQEIVAETWVFRPLFQLQPRGGEE
jgi:prepilin-type N-terminal cleavage/methylation domain-containing protein